MRKPSLVRITTVPISLEKLLEGQLKFLSNDYAVTAISNNEDELKKLSDRDQISYFPLDLTRKITPVKDLLAVFKLFLFLRRTRPEIVHTHTPKAGLVGMLSAFLARVPIRLHTVAGLPLMEATGFKRKLLIFVEKLTYRAATNVYPNSNGLKEFILDHAFTTPSKLKIIGNGSSNGIDIKYFDPAPFTSEFKTQLRKKLGISQDAFVFIFVGRMVTDKGINELVSAFQKMDQTSRDLHLLLVGQLEQDLDPLDSKTLNAIEQGTDITYTGYQNDVRPYFSISNALVFPSYREGFPNVVMQAGAMGLPIIASDINGCNEIVVNGKNGWLVPKKDEISLNQALQKLLDDESAYLSMKQKARPMIVQRFDRPAIWKALKSEYESQITRL